MIMSKAGKAQHFRPKGNVVYRKPMLSHIPETKFSDHGHTRAGDDRLISVMHEFIQSCFLGLQSKVYGKLYQRLYTGSEFDTG